MLIVQGHHTRQIKVVIYQKVGIIVRTPSISFLSKCSHGSLRPRMEALLLSPLSCARSGRYLTTVVGLRDCHTARQTD